MIQTQLALDLLLSPVSVSSNPELLLQKSVYTLKSLESGLKKIPEEYRDRIRTEVIREIQEILGENQVLPTLLTIPKIQGIQKQGSCLVTVGKELAKMLTSSSPINTKVLQGLMSAVYEGTDAQGRWIWKDVYEALEVGLVLYLRQIGSELLKLDLYQTLEQLIQLEASLPTHTRRSEDQITFQQFSTPLGLSFITGMAANINSTDLVLEPSAGNGLLAIWAEIAGAKLVLNEIYKPRRDTLIELFPDIPVSEHNGEQIDDLLDEDLKPSVVLINPPFSASPKMNKRNPMATWKHISSALHRLQSGGRLVAITADWFSPLNPDWTEYFAKLRRFGFVSFSAGIEGRAYRKHGTTVETRLTIIERGETRFDFGEIIDDKLNLKDLLQHIQIHLPRYKAEEPIEDTEEDVLEFVDLPKYKDIKPSEDEDETGLNLIVTAPKPTEPQEVPLNWDEIIEVEYSAIEENRECQELTEGIYESYQPQTIQIHSSQPHPSPLVESAAMSSVKPPMPSYRPLLPRRLINDGFLSAAQLETIIYAGDSHQKFLSNWYIVDETLDLLQAANETEEGAVHFRRGYSLGDNTGVGKGRQIAGIIIDNWLQGRKKALWLSKNETLLEDAQRDFCALGGKEDQIIPLSKFKLGKPIELSEGILFVTYATLRSDGKDNKISRLQQIVNFLGKDFDGPIIFDESHAMANAANEKADRGVKKASQQGISGLRLQRALPSARVVYVSATGASRLENLSYMERLGLWGTDSMPFRTRDEFVSLVQTGGVAAAEVVARDLKSLGMYTARSLSFDGVAYQVLEHELSEAQVEIYDKYANAYQIIHQHIGEALRATNVLNETGKTRNGFAASAAYSSFESAKQRFFGHLLSSMKSQTLIQSIEKDLHDGHAAIVQLVSTDEALLDRRLASIPTSEWADLNVDITPKEYLFVYLKNAFPITLHQVWTDKEGVERTKQMLDEDGSPIICQEALRARDTLIEDLALLPPVPSLLDQLIHHFGHQEVAEITGRSKRIVKEMTATGEKLMVQRRSSNANLAETQMFQDDQKKILIFSNAGSTGRSYHAELTVQNLRLRRHYVVEYGWEASVTVQGLGRSNRSNQKQPPVFVLVTTNVKGERRFTSTIARRLDSLGAITKGERKTGGQGLFRETDNLESLYAKTALRQLFEAIYHGQIETCSLPEFEAMTALKLTTTEGYLREELPPMKQFLNRCLALTIEKQQALFEELERRVNSNIEAAIEAGTYSLGIEVLRAEGFKVLERRTIYTQPDTGAMTQAVKIERTQKVKIVTVEEAEQLAKVYEGKSKFVLNNRSNRVALVLPTTNLITEKGESIPRVRLVRPASESKISLEEYEDSYYKEITFGTFARAWQEEINETPKTKTDTFFLITGLLLPIWKRLEQSNLKVFRLTTDDGERLLGRMVLPFVWEAISGSFGVEYQLSSQEIFKSVWERGESVKLNQTLSLRASTVAGNRRLEIVNFTHQEFHWLKSLGAFSEMIQHRMRLFLPAAESSSQIIDKIRSAVS